MEQKQFKRYTVTSALPYANGGVHIGHLAGVYVPADIYVRYLRAKKREVSTIMGSLSNTLEGLCSNTTYYVRAYVVSDSGLSYGNEVSFTTLEGGGSGNVPIGAINGLFTINANGDQVY